MIFDRFLTVIFADVGNGDTSRAPADHLPPPVNKTGAVAPWHRGTARASARGPLPAGQMLRVDFLSATGLPRLLSGPRVPRLPSAAKCAKSDSELPPSGIGKYCSPLRGSEDTVIPDVLPRQLGTQLTFGITNRSLHSTKAFGSIARFTR